MSKIIKNRTKWMNTRLTPEEYKVIHTRLKNSMCRSMSEYSRTILLQKPVTFTYRDKSMNDMLEELIILRRELNYIGSNFNQAVYKLNSTMGMPEARLWQEAFTILKDQLGPCLREIKIKMNIYSELWSKSLSVKKNNEYHFVLFSSEIKLRPNSRHVNIN